MAFDHVNAAVLSEIWIVLPACCHYCGTAAWTLESVTAPCSLPEHGFAVLHAVVSPAREAQGSTGSYGSFFLVVQNVLRRQPY